MTDRNARSMWQPLEPIHAVTYFAPEARAASDGAGLRGFWMGYFAQRAAPRGLLGDAIGSESMKTAANIAWDAAPHAATAGRVLAAANQALPEPTEPHLRLWQAATTLREHRGDGHVAVLLANDISPVAAHHIKAAAGETDTEALRTARQWSDDEWQDGRTALRERGWLDEAYALTIDGRQAHNHVEEQTDRAAAQPWRVLGRDRTTALAELLRPLAEAIVESGVVPHPNPVGMPWPPATW